MKNLGPRERQPHAIALNGGGLMASPGCGRIGRAQPRSGAGRSISSPPGQTISPRLVCGAVNRMRGRIASLENVTQYAPWFKLKVGPLEKRNFIRSLLFG